MDGPPPPASRPASPGRFPSGPVPGPVGPGSRVWVCAGSVGAVGRCVSVCSLGGCVCVRVFLRG